jgi:hypothetical protein
MLPPAPTAPLLPAGPHSPCVARRGLASLRQACATWTASVKNILGQVSFPGNAIINNSSTLAWAFLDVYCKNARYASFFTLPRVCSIPIDRTCAKGAQGVTIRQIGKAPEDADLNRIAQELAVPGKGTQ